MVLRDLLSASCSCRSSSSMRIEAVTKLSRSTATVTYRKSRIRDAGTAVSKGKRSSLEHSDFDQKGGRGRAGQNLKEEDTAKDIKSHFKNEKNEGHERIMQSEGVHADNQVKRQDC